MRFIKLTRESDGEKIYINLDYIVAIYPYYNKPNVTVVDAVYNEGGGGYEVKESADYIVQLLKG